MPQVRPKKNKKKKKERKNERKRKILKKLYIYNVIWCYSPAQTFPVLLMSHWAKVLLWPIRSYMICHPLRSSLYVYGLLSFAFPFVNGLQPPWPLAFTRILLRWSPLINSPWGFLFGILFQQLDTQSPAHLLKVSKPL